jgi:glutamine amidotransferase
MAMIGILRMPICNLQSVWNAVYGQLGLDPVMVDSASNTDDLTHLIVPGVGNFRAVMRHLEEQGLADRIRAFAATGRPLLGICAGMQLLATAGTEGGETEGLNLVPGKVVRLPDDKEFRLPHVGWNTVIVRHSHPVFHGLKRERDFYFVHSYAMITDEETDWLASTDYGKPFACIVGRANVIGFQFHPEKSQVNGLRLLENFCQWDGKC